MNSSTPPAEAQLPTAANAVKPKRRATGKIAQLPREVRQQLNLMLADGLTYVEVIEGLGDSGKHLNEDNVRRWHAGPYQQWLKDLPWIEQLSINLDFATAVLDDEDSPKLREASLVIAIKQMYELIKSFEPADFKQQLAEDPAAYSRILNSLAKLAEIGLKYDRERSEITRVTIRETAKSKKAAGLTDDLLRQYENEFQLLRRPPLPAVTRPSEPTESASTSA